MMLKITQLETLAEVQHAEIAYLKKNFKEHLQKAMLQHHGMHV